ncbi:MAG TPA: YkgJ family cysteine cluster protein [Acidovorax sp.]|nr:YkgJ family cysteine cluster protein [Acidovorax sp.]
MTSTIKIDAGDFDAWLQSLLVSFKTGAGMDVPCGSCRGCCSAGRFVHLLPTDKPAHAAIPAQLLMHAPGMPRGHAVMGYLDSGHCPMLKAGNCSVYASRPSTCRTFDCRVLAATGLFIDGRWSERINERVKAWEFSFSSEQARQRLRAMKDAACFIQKNAAAFPGGRVPTDPASVAVLAIKVHPVLLAIEADASPREIAEAIIAESRRVEERAGQGL